MNRIDAAFAKLKESGHGGLMPFVCAGAPTADALTQVLPALSAAGAASIEVGIPFSDPIADGLTDADRDAAAHSCRAESGGRAVFPQRRTGSGADQ